MNETIDPTQVKLAETYTPVNDSRIYPGQLMIPTEKVGEWQALVHPDNSDNFRDMITIPDWILRVV